MYSREKQPGSRYLDRSSERLGLSLELSRVVLSSIAESDFVFCPPTIMPANTRRVGTVPNCARADEAPVVLTMPSLST